MEEGEVPSGFVSVSCGGESESEVEVVGFCRRVQSFIFSKTNHILFKCVFI